MCIADYIFVIFLSANCVCVGQKVFMVFTKKIEYIFDMYELF